ncbi:hypothetical protein [Sphingobium yanoikuyae]|uniref:Uncharacterized protein n=1 Tax=Sphingobium yanoikuyae TaxID=13690 RepID=A0A430BWU0_SPHYA|nr:hypothetical protein [Sphingobium yanoikuyae]RSU57224.1 hypothetical protein DAH51_10450 [Sphingobium yanoikuyae]
MNSTRTMIVWASGLIEFICDREAPDGAIVVCTVRHKHDLEELLHVVQRQTILHDFGDVVGLRIPGIDPARPAVEDGIDLAVDGLIRWEEDVRSSLGFFNQIEWTRP